MNTAGKSAIEELLENNSKLVEKVKEMQAEIDRLKAMEAATESTILKGQVYYYIDSRGELVWATRTCSSSTELERERYYNMFQFRGDYELSLTNHIRMTKLNNRLLQLKLLYCPEYQPNWANNMESKFYIYYDNKNFEFRVGVCQFIESFTVYFSKEGAEKACATMNETWKWSEE